MLIFNPTEKADDGSTGVFYLEPAKLFNLSLVQVGAILYNLPSGVEYKTAKLIITSEYYHQIWLMIKVLNTGSIVGIPKSDLQSFYGLIYQRYNLIPPDELKDKIRKL